MFRFICRVLMISTFFVGLGAIAEKVQNALIPTENGFVFVKKIESETKKVRVIRFENSENQNQFRFVLANPEDSAGAAEKIACPLAKKKIVIFRQGAESLN